MFPAILAARAIAAYMTQRGEQPPLTILFTGCPLLGFRREGVMSLSGRVRVGLASVLLSVLALSAGAETDLQSDCQWAVDDPERVVRACTALIAEEKRPAAWMHFNRGLAFKVQGRLKEAERDYSR